MDFYRYFHPHHNPRLRSVPLRLQELGELEQAAVELVRALERAELRAEASADPELPNSIRKEHFSQVLEAARYVSETLSILTHAHPGDSPHEMQQLLRERETAPGWENWSKLVRQRLMLEGPRLTGTFSRKE